MAFNIKLFNFRHDTLVKQKQTVISSTLLPPHQLTQTILI